MEREREREREMYKLGAVAASKQYVEVHPRSIEPYT